MTDREDSLIIPDDHLGRAWMTGFPEGPGVVDKDAVATMVAVDDSGNLNVLGHAFVVLAAGTKAICLAAAHSFEPVKWRQEARRGRSALQMAPDFRPQGPEYFNSDEVHVSFLVGGEVVQCTVEELNYFAGNDLAVFVVSARHGAPFKMHFAIDLAVPKIGDVVMAFANEMVVDRLEGEGQFQVAQTFQIRKGVVTNVVWDRAKVPGLSYYFQTTIPFPPGMSGAPVLLAPLVGGPLLACGVVSSDMSQEAARSDMLVPGSSSVSMLWPAMGLGLHATLDDGHDGHILLGDLLKRGLLDNRTVGVDVVVAGTKEETIVSYIDNRVNPPFAGRLSLPGHPDA